MVHVSLRTYHDILYTSKGIIMNINEMLNNKKIDCSCGKEHFCSVKTVIIEEAALGSVPDILEEAGCRKAFFLYDRNTYLAAGYKLSEIIKYSGIQAVHYVIEENRPVPDEKTIGTVLLNFDSDCNIIAAVGSGTINDISRFISFKLKLPYIIIATAPSMDGFASSVAPLISGGMKTTYPAHAPYAIIGDLDILKNAPAEMIAAGIGDILGKYTSLCDWEIAHIITGEYKCEALMSLVRQALHEVTANINMIAGRDTEGIKSLMEALVLSGIAMSYAGNSRPASGSEHHLSHYWEMISLMKGEEHALHGTQVGVAAVAVLKAYELLAACDVDFSERVGYARTNAAMYCSRCWEKYIRSIYGRAADQVIALEASVKKNYPSNVLPRIDKIENAWEDIKGIIKGLPSADNIKGILSRLPAPYSPAGINVDKDAFESGFKAAKELRNRYGLLQLLFDLGLTEDIASDVWEYFIHGCSL